MKIFRDMEVDFRSIVNRLTDSMVESKLISDTNTGSVVKLMAESFAREMAVFYSIMEKAHEAGYLETAKGPALENVVAVLGMERAKGELLRGRVTFSRRSSAIQDIGIPTGTKVTGPPIDGAVLPTLETVEPSRIKIGERSVSVAVQEIPDENIPECDKISADVLSILPRPLLGIESVSNPEPITRSGKPEDDDHLRARAESILRENQTCSTDAIQAVIKGLGVDTVRVIESPDNLYGSIEVHLDDPELEKNPAREIQIRQAIREVKAAGIHMDIKLLRSLFCQPIFTVTLSDEDLAEESFEQLADKIRQDITAFINATKPGVAIPRAKLTGIVVGDPIIEDVVGLDMKAVTIEYTASGDENFIWKANGWEVNPLENPKVDPDRWPVTVVRKWPLKARMNLSVTIKQDVEKIQAQKDIRELAEEYLNENTLTKELRFTDLEKTLAKGFEGLVLEPTWIVRQSDGRVEELNREHSIALENGEQVIVDAIDIKIVKKSNNG